MKKQNFKLAVVLICLIPFLNCSSNSDAENCSTIVCQNGGTFSNCECNCPQGYSGVNCSNQVTPSRISITKVIVKSFPNTDLSGGFWDPTIPTADDGLPDIYITFQNSDLNVIYDSPTFFGNAISDGSTFYEFTLNPPLVITNYSNPYLVSIWDYDVNNADDFMTSEGFFIYNSTGGFPETLTVLDTSEPILVDITLTYQWN
jgi:hypothetical protein